MSDTATVSNSYFASSGASRSLHRSLQAAWQMVILPRPSRSVLASDPTGGAASEYRVDAPHAGIATPHDLLNWSDLVGLHPTSALQPLPLSGPGAVSQPNALVALAPPQRDEVPRELTEELAEAAHEVRTPIAGALQALMMVTTQRTAGQTLDERELQLLQAAQMRLLHASRWAEDILSERNLAQRPHAGVRRRFYPDQWRQEMAPIVQSAADKQAVKLEWDGWDRSLPRMYMDPNHLSRVTMNLVMNAIQASPQGSSVVIRVAAQSNVSQRLLISVEDRGVGLDAQLMRLVNSSQPWPEAMLATRQCGLGLRTVKALTESMGGSISVQRGAHGGTLFRLALPVDDLRFLVRQWLMRRAATQGLHPEAKLSIYAIKTTEMDNELIDRHLQLSASEGEFVYRVAKSQWLWMQLTAPGMSGAGDIHSLTSKLNLFGKRSQARARCQADLMGTLLDLPFAQRHEAYDDAQRLRGLLETIYGHAQHLMDGRVSPLDYVTTNVDMPVEATIVTPEPVRPRSEPLADSAATRSISDVAKQWRMIHSKLEKLHNRHLRSAPAV